MVVSGGVGRSGGAPDWILIVIQTILWWIHGGASEFIDE